MKLYKEKLKSQIKWSWIFLTMQIFLLGLLWVFFADSPQGFSVATATPLFFAWGNGAILILIRNYYILKNPIVLENQFIKEQDERNLKIEAEASKTGILIILGILYFSMIISSILHRVVFFTLLIAWFFAVFVLLMVKAYYRRHM